MLHKLMTNPMFMLEFNRPGIRGINLESNTKLEALSDMAIEVLHQGLEGDVSNMHPDVLQKAQEVGLLISKDSANPSVNWEKNKWSRAAYLTYSQLDLDYLEPVEEGISLSALNNTRRDIIEAQKKTGPYPSLNLVETKTVITLSVPQDIDEDLDALMRRKSQRSFQKSPISFDDFSAILYEATTNIRIANESQASGDPFFLFNSFYCWVQLYIVVQGVEGIERGLYQYDSTTHQLRQIKKGIEDEDIYACIQHQYWVKGGGFCVFISAHWERYMWIYRHSRAYINLMIQAGELGQEIYVAANKYFLAGWGTPAINETKAADLIGLNERDEDAIYFIKIGIPKE